MFFSKHKIGIFQNLALVWRNKCGKIHIFLFLFITEQLESEDTTKNKSLQDRITTKGR